MYLGRLCPTTWCNYSYDINKQKLTLPDTIVAQGSEITDADGTRQATLIIPAGVTARLDDGTLLVT